MDGTTILIVRLAAFIATAVRCLVERKRCGGHRKNDYGNTYSRMVETATR